VRSKQKLTSLELLSNRARIHTHGLVLWHYMNCRGVRAPNSYMRSRSVLSSVAEPQNNPLTNALPSLQPTIMRTTGHWLGAFRAENSLSAYPCVNVMPFATTFSSSSSGLKGLSGLLQACVSSFEAYNSIF
jgi:hypothetical protein